MKTKHKTCGNVFSVMHLTSGSEVSSDSIGVYKVLDNGDIEVKLEKLPWGGGHMIMRPAPAQPKTNNRQKPSP
jgi:hypothetical protein